MTVQVIQAKKSVHGISSAAPHRLRVAAYARVSTDSDEQEGSYAIQCAHYTEYIRSNAEWDFAGMYADEGISGTQARKRPGFVRMIEDCRAGMIDLVITKSISRWARNTLDSLTYIRELRSLGVGVYFEKENIHTLDSKGELLITIMSSIAQQESQSISQNVRMGIQHRMQLGQGRLNTAFFLGYTKDRETGAYVIVPEEAATVRRIYREYITGYSPAQIARHLENDHVCTPSGAGHWYASTIRSILENEKYCGDLLLQKYYTRDVLTHQIVRNTGEFPQYYVADDHDPIIPREIWMQVQDELLRRSVYRNDPTRFMFGPERGIRGRIICGHCGKYMRWYGNHSTWCCRPRNRPKQYFAPSAGCEERMVIVVGGVEIVSDTAVEIPGDVAVEIPENAPVCRSSSVEAASASGCLHFEAAECSSACDETCIPDIPGNIIESAVLTAFNYLPETLDMLEHILATLQDNKITPLTEEIARSDETDETNETDEANETNEANKTDEANGALPSFNEQFTDYKKDQHRHALLLAKSELVYQASQTMHLIEFIQDLFAEQTDIYNAQASAEACDEASSIYFNETPPASINSACYDAVDFLQRTRYTPPDILSADGTIHTLDDQIISRYMDEVTCWQTRIDVHFRGGITIRIPVEMADTSEIQTEIIPPDTADTPFTMR